jgi:dTMP kinase
VSRGTLITVEGIDGAGKSTQVRLLHALLSERGYATVATFEPGATPLGREVRRLLLGSDVALTPDGELLLFLADRADHVARVIEPALADGAIVLCDRFSDSTVAYQGYGRAADVARIRRWNDETSRGVQPDLTLLLDCPVSEGARRRHRANDRYQLQDPAYHQRVRDGFLAIAAAASARVRVIDTSVALDDVSAEVAHVTLAWLGERGIVPRGG